MKTLEGDNETLLTVCDEPQTVRCSLLLDISLAALSQAGNVSLEGIWEASREVKQLILRKRTSEGWFRDTCIVYRRFAKHLSATTLKRYGIIGSMKSSATLLPNNSMLL
jgi:hypothetical protein